MLTRQQPLGRGHARAVRAQEGIQAAALAELEDEGDGGGNHADACTRTSSKSSAKQHWAVTAAPSQRIAADSKPQSGSKPQSAGFSRQGVGGITQELHDAVVLQQRAEIGLVCHLQQHLRAHGSDDAGR